MNRTEPIELTEAQRLAVTSTAARKLIIAGAGSGKTETLTRSIKHLVENRVDPKNCCVVTFTNNAAAELEKRLDGIRLGYCGTLHSLMVRALRKAGETDFTVIDAEQTEAVLDMAIEEMRYKKSRKALSELVNNWSTLPRGGFHGEVELAAQSFLLKLRHENMLTFDMLLSNGLTAVQRQPGVLPFTHLFVDEFQDSGTMDYRIYDAMPAEYKFFVGDHRQAIYGFRGGVVQNIIDMSTDPRFEVVNLSENFRCDEAICQAANRLMTHAQNGGQPMASRTGQPGSIQVMEAPTGDREIVTIADDILATFGECAVLLRTNYLVGEWATGLERLGVAVKKREQPKVPDDWRKAKDFLSLLANPDNDRLAFLAICHSQGPGEASKVRLAALRQLKTINQIALKLPQKIPVTKAIETLGMMGVSSASLERVESSFDLLPVGAGMADLLIAVSREDLRGEETGEGVVVTTYHAAKGREWANVFLPAFEDQVIPGDRSDVDIEEERRCAYVAATRARHRLVISHAAKRRSRWKAGEMIEHRPSRFLAELV